jgi:CheY-like chemotaxis protein
MRILVVDDHEVVRRGIRSVLAGEPAYVLCGEAVDGEDAVQKARAFAASFSSLDKQLLWIFWKRRASTAIVSTFSLKPIKPEQLINIIKGFSGNEGETLV